MTTITTKQGQTATLTIDTKTQKATLNTNGVVNLIAFIRDNKIIIKNDMLLNDGDMASVKSQMTQFIKNVETGKKRK